jgi:hypothetical protein
MRVWLLVLVLAVAVFGGVYVFEGGSSVGYVVVDGVRVYLVNSSVSLFVDYGGNVTVVYCGGVLWGVGPGVWFNVSLSSISIFEVYVDGVLVDRFAVKPARTSHNPFVTDLTLSLSKTRVVRGEVVSARLSWVRHSWCPADFVKVLGAGEVRRREQVCVFCCGSGAGGVRGEGCGLFLPRHGQLFRPRLGRRLLRRGLQGP